MAAQESTGQRLIALGVLGAWLLNYPILALFGNHGLVAGIPVLYLYLLVTWGALILILALILEAWPFRPTAKGRPSNKPTHSRDA